MKTYDAIVVGAGHNGLTTAAFLAKAGLDVVCVEKNDYIGGATVSRCCLHPLGGTGQGRRSVRRRGEVVHFRKKDG